MTLNNSTLSGNDANFVGGGIYTRSGDVTLRSSTVTGNSAFIAGGVHVRNDAANSTRMVIENTIVAGNTIDDGASDLNPNPSGVLSVDYSLIGDTSGSGISAGTGVGNILNQSAGLGPLANNGGLTQTHELLENSLAIDAGSNALALDINGNPLTTDQRGEVRIKAGTVDIGAVEFGDPFLLGDVNRDGAVTFLDISPFISLLASSTFQVEADINGDGAVTFLDISPFINLLAGGSPQSSPATGNLVAPATSSETTVAHQAVVVEPQVSSSVSVSEPEAIVSIAAPVEVPVTTETSAAKQVTAKAAPVSPNVALIKPLPQASLVLANDSSVSPVIETEQPPAVDLKVAKATSVETARLVGTTTPVDTFIGPVPIAPVKYSFLGGRNSSLRAAESSGLLVTRRTLKGNAEQLVSSYESRAANLITNVPAEESFSTAAELFDAHPESLNGVFDFEVDEALAGLIE